MMYGIKPENNNLLYDSNKFVDRTHGYLTSNIKEMYLSTTKEGCRNIIEFGLPIGIHWNVVQLPPELEALACLMEN